MKSQIGFYYALDGFSAGYDHSRTEEWAIANYLFQRAIDGMVDVPKFAESLDTVEPHRESLEMAIQRRKAVLI